MKTMKKIIIALFAIATLNVVSSVMPAGTAKASSSMITRSVTDAQVISYLQAHGFSLITIVQTYADGTRKCTTNHVGYYCLVYLNSDQTAIVGYEEFPG